MVRLCCILLGGFLFICCEKKSNRIIFDTDRKFRDIVSIEEKGMLEIDTDSVTSPMVNALQEYEDSSGNHFLMYLNEETGNLYINDLSNGGIVDRIVIKDLKNSYKKPYQGFYFHSRDSIFVFSFLPKVLLVDNKGDIKKEYILRGKDISDDRNDLLFKGIWSSTLVASYLKGDSLLLGSVRFGNASSGKKYIQIVLNLKTGYSSEGSIVAPEIYNRFNFGGKHYDMYSVCANPIADLLVYSFPGYQNLMIQSLKSNEIYEEEAGSRRVTYFEEFDKLKYKNSKPKEHLEYFMNTSCFGGIYFDRYRNLYYRISLLPIDNSSFYNSGKKPQSKQLSISVFDSKFRYLGEKLLEKNKYEMFSAFVSHDGFFIQNKIGKDDILRFTRFSVREI